MEIENWCEINYGSKEIWNRRLPSTISKNEEEKRLGKALKSIRQKMKQYERVKLEEVENKEDKKILELLRRLDNEYGLGTSLKNALEIENWCEINYGSKEIWNRKLPSTISKNGEEERLGNALGSIRKGMKQYEGIELGDVEKEEDRRILEIVRKLDNEYGLDVLLKKALEIENWCKVKFAEEKMWDRRLPSITSKNEEEKRLGKALSSIRQKMKQYEGMKLEEVENEEDKKILELLRILDSQYGLSASLKNALKIENWCKSNYGDKEIWNRKLPNDISNDEEEKRLGQALRTIKKQIKQYEGIEVEKVENEEDRKILEIVRKLDNEYGLSSSLKNALEIENWCKVNYGDKEIWDRKLPSQHAKDEEEKRLGVALNALRQRRLKQYEGKEIEEVENEEDRRILEIIRRLDEEYNPRKFKQQELLQAKKKRDEAKSKNSQAKELEGQVSEQLKKRGQTYDEQ